MIRELGIFLAADSEIMVTTTILNEVILMLNWRRSIFFSKYLFLTSHYLIQLLQFPVDDELNIEICSSITISKSLFF